jgi:hypothetical protein
MRNFLIAISIISFVSISAKAQPKTLHAKIDAAADKIEPQTISWRRDFHEHPELGNREFRTSKIIADYLRSLRCSMAQNQGQL